MTAKKFVTIVMMLSLPWNLAFAGKIANVEMITCQEAQNDFNMTSRRLTHLGSMLKNATDDSIRLVLKTEIISLLNLRRGIQVFLTENCKEA